MSRVLVGARALMARILKSQKNIPCACVCERCRNVDAGHVQTLSFPHGGFAYKRLYLVCTVKFAYVV